MPDERDNPGSVEAALALPAVAKLLRYHEMACDWADPHDVCSAGHDAVMAAVANHKPQQKFSSSVRYYLKKRLASLAAAYAETPEPAGLLWDCTRQFEANRPSAAFATRVGEVNGLMRTVLNDRQRKALTKVFLEGKSRTDAAAELGTNTTMLGKLITQSVKKLREVMDLPTHEECERDA